MSTATAKLWTPSRRLWTPPRRRSLRQRLLDRLRSMFAVPAKVGGAVVRSGSAMADKYCCCDEDGGAGEISYIVLVQDYTFSGFTGTLDVYRYFDPDISAFGPNPGSTTTELGGRLAADAVTGRPEMIVSRTGRPTPGGSDLSSGTAQTAAASSITLKASETYTDNEIVDDIVYITSGTGAGQHRLITSYDSTTKIAGVDFTWTVTPDNTSFYRIKPGEFTDYVTGGPDEAVLFAAITAESDAANPTTARWEAGRFDDLIDIVRYGGVGNAEVLDDVAWAEWQSSEWNYDYNYDITAAFRNEVTSGDRYVTKTILGLGDIAPDELGCVPGGFEGGCDESNCGARTGSDEDLATGDTTDTSLAFGDPLSTSTAQAGAPNSITLAAGEGYLVEDIIGLYVNLTGGTGLGQSRRITDYDEPTKVAKVRPNWNTTPDATTVYEIVDLQNGYRGNAGLYASGTGEFGEDAGDEVGPGYGRDLVFTALDQDGLPQREGNVVFESALCLSFGAAYAKRTFLSTGLIGGHAGNVTASLPTISGDKKTATSSFSVSLDGQTINVTLTQTLICVGPSS